MFKRAHIALSEYLSEEIQVEEITRHKRSLAFGSILPDISPRQRMKSHEFDANWEDTKELIHTLETMEIKDSRTERALCRKMGMLFHYLSDYFTCPHNPSCHIGMLEHCVYECAQAYLLNTFLSSQDAKEQFSSQRTFAEQFRSSDELISYIEQMHNLYLQKEANDHTPQDDCRWILNVCACATLVLIAKVYGDAKQRECMLQFA